MLVIGYKTGADFNSAAKVIIKHMSHSLQEASKLCDRIKKGEAVSLPNDFVLRDDLKELQFLIS